MLGGDLELDENEKRMLELAEAEDEDELDDIENMDQKLLGKRRKPPVKIAVEDEPELELEYEREDQIKAKKQKIKHSKHSGSKSKIDF